MAANIYCSSSVLRKEENAFGFALVLFLFILQITIQQLFNFQCCLLHTETKADYLVTYA